MLVERNELVRVWSFGEFRVEYRAPDGSWKAVEPQEWGGNAHSRHVLRYLLLYGRKAGRGTLMQALWPGSDSLYLDDYLSKAVSNIRKVFRAEDSDQLVQTKNERTLYAFADQSVIWTDMDACEAAMQEAECLEHTSTEGCGLLETALTYLGRGRLFEGEDGLWCHAKRDLFETAHYRCLLWLSEAYEAQGKLRQAEAQIEKLLHKDPLDETALLRLLVLLQRQGMTAEALRRYKSATALFAKHDVCLSSEIETLARQLRMSPLLLTRAQSNEQALLSTSEYTQKPLLLSSPLRSTSKASLFALPAVSDVPTRDKETGDCATCFSERLVHILACITQKPRQISMTDFEKKLDHELQALHEMQTMFDSETALLSRRNALLVIAALPKGLLGLLEQASAAFIEEAFLPACAASITICWSFLNSGEFDALERALARFVPLLVEWAQQPSTYQKTAAYLASQSYLLLSIVQLHRLQFQQRTVSCQKAVTYGRLSGNTALLIRTLTNLGSLYYEQGLYREMLQVCQQAMFLYQETRTPLPHILQSKVFMVMAHAQAQHGKTREALNAICQARTLYPEKVEDDLPVFLSANDGYWMLILYEGRVGLDLGRGDPTREHFAYAAQALAHIEELSKTLFIPERFRIEITNQRAKAAIALGDLPAFHAYTLQSVEGLQAIKSAKRKQELVANYKDARKKWPRESQVLELADLLL